jgi:hypothetical protein
MRMRLITIVAAVIFAGVGMATPSSARTKAHHLASGKTSVGPTSVGPTEALQQFIQQGGTPPIGYCLKCLAPSYQWPRGGAGPG